MGIFNRNFRCFDGDSIDCAAMFESIYENATYDNSSDSTFSNSDDLSSTDSTE